MTELSTVMGIDFGTDSVRAVIFNATNGDAIADAVVPYPRWQQGRYCEPTNNQFRQHPLDYLESLESVVQELLAKAPLDVRQTIKGISVDTTGSTPVAVDRAGTPLALTAGFQENPNAMFVLWKDHTAIKEAEEINQLANHWDGPDYTRYVGGIYSSEWFWAKMLRVFREDAQVRSAAWSWVEHCDWISAELSGDTDPLTLKRSRCAAGHKAMWHDSFDGLPAEDFLATLDPLLAGVRERLYAETHTADIKAGTLSAEWANKFGLDAGISIGVGALDAHAGAVGAGIQAYSLVKVMGTSTCDMLIVPSADVDDTVVRGICGQVDGSIVPGMLGLEAGQSAFGDVYSWYRDLLLWPIEHLLKKSKQLDAATKNKVARELTENLINGLSQQAAMLPVETSGVVALDWLNGRRTPDANPTLNGSIAGLTLGSDAPRIYRALVEATAFGAKSIVERFVSEGIKLNEVIALGGVAKKSPLVMQIMADVLNMSIKVASAEHACALGAAMYASVAAGLHSSIEVAQQAMGSGFDKEYYPIAKHVEQYEHLYQRYSRLGDFVEHRLDPERAPQ